jgi:hypothetical protein
MNKKANKWLLGFGFIFVVFAIIVFSINQSTQMKMERDKCFSLPECEMYECFSEHELLYSESQEDLQKALICYQKKEYNKSG